MMKARLLVLLVVALCAVHLASAKYAKCPSETIESFYEGKITLYKLLFGFSSKAAWTSARS